MYDSEYHKNFRISLSYDNYSDEWEWSISDTYNGLRIWESGKEPRKTEALTKAKEKIDSEIDNFKRSFD